MRFLCAWQHAAPETQLAGPDGLRAVLAQLDGFELAADAWERHVLPLRVKGYDRSLLDMLCFSGEVAWSRLSAPARGPVFPGATPRPIRATPIALCLREHMAAWQAVAPRTGAEGDNARSAIAVATLDVLTTRGASFVHEIASVLGRTAEEIQSALAELVASGTVTSDGFGGLRAMIAPVSSQPRHLMGFRPRSRPPVGATAGGRWARVPRADASATDREAAVEQYAGALLRRYGVVFRRLLAREPYDVAWRDLIKVFRRLEARGEVRGGRFVAGMSGEQFALPEAVELARETRRRAATGATVTVSAADPLNLAGIITGETRIAAQASGTVSFTDGIPLEAGAPAAGRQDVEAVTS